MCVALPGRVVSIGEPTATSVPARVRYGDREPVDVDLVMVTDVAVGDYVIVHSGYAISRVLPDRAQATLDLLDPS